MCTLTYTSIYIHVCNINNLQNIKLALVHMTHMYSIIYINLQRYIFVCMTVNLGNGL